MKELMMIKMLAAVCRRPGMTHAEYVAYVQHVHGKIATENPVGLRSYKQNHVFDAAFGALSQQSHALEMPYDSVTELYWDSPEAMKANFAHEHVRTKVGPDAVNFSDSRKGVSLVAEEHEQPVVNPSLATGAKVIHYLRAAEGLDLDTFFSRWAQAHQHVLDSSPFVAANLRRCVHNHQRPEFNEMLAYFGDSDVPIYEGVSSLWFDDVTSVGAFREYERNILAMNQDPTSVFYQPEQSFFLYVTEIPIYTNQSN
jgi:hypothetical protein